MSPRKAATGNDVTMIRSADGTMIAVERVGRGPALVCVDAALCTRAQGPGKSLAPRLSEHFTVYTYDRRGRGASEDTAPYAVEREIEDLDAVITEAGGAANVFGHSSGAVLALEAARHGVTIARLALYETPFVVDDTRPPVGTDWPNELRATIDDGRRGRAITRFMTEVARAPAFVPVVMSLTPMWPRLKAIVHTLSYDSAIMAPYQKGTPLPIDRFASVTTPTLLLLGGRSPTWMKNSIQALNEVLPHAELNVLHRQTHMVRPNVTAPALLEFFGPGQPSTASVPDANPGRPAPQARAPQPQS